MTKPVDYALFYASKGWQVFPCKPKDKTPMVKWADEATTDTEKIKAWWGANPTANIGIATGARSGIVVLDVDAGHGGADSLNTLTANNGALPLTPTALTGGGGHHYVFSHPGIEVRNSASKVGQGIDVRGDGGYIVAPPSIHPSGNDYRWVKLPSNTGLAPAPQWLLSAMTAATPSDYPEKKPVQQTEQMVSAAYASGSRNTTLASLAGTMRRRGMSEQAIYNALMTENTARCIPPLSDDEVRQIAASVSRYTPQNAPLTNKMRERMQVEWFFARCCYENPALVNEFSWVTPQMFSDEALAKFWSEIRKGENATAAAVTAGVLTDLKDMSIEIARVEEYANQIAHFGFLESIAQSASELEKNAKDGNLQKVKGIIASISEASPVSSATVKTAYDGLMEFQSSLTDERVVLRTGIPNLDRAIGGLPRKVLAILAARPSVGKTTLAWQIARNVSSSGYKVCFFSLEVSAMSLWRKAALGIAEVSYKQVTGGNVRPEKMEEIQTSIIPDLVDAYNERLFMYDEPCTTDTIWKITMQTAPDLIVIDHLGYINDKNEDEVKRLGMITKRLKQLAKSANCHVLLIHQLSRAVEARKDEDKKPKLSDLRDSGHIEQDADIVIMPYRPEYYEMRDAGTKPRYSETQLLIRKNRDDEAGMSVAVYYDLLQQWFYRLEELPPSWRNAKIE